MKIPLIHRTILSLSLIIGLSVYAAAGKNVLCTTFPMYQLAGNVAQGSPSIKLDLLLPAGMGCPHDYALTPQDMRKLARADALLINGLGLEEFLGAPLKSANPNLVVIDSSAGIGQLLEYGGSDHVHKTEHQHHDCDQHNGRINPHLFASPRQAARLVMNIAAELSKLDPDNAGIYLKNAQAYAGRLNRLADEFSAAGRNLKNRRIVQPHGIMDYLARDMGLEIVATTLAHGQEPSAADMLKLVKTMREQKVGVIFAEPQYSDKHGRTLSRETKVPLVFFDPAAAGPDKAPLDYYETVMRTNLRNLVNALGK